MDTNPKFCRAADYNLLCADPREGGGAFFRLNKGMARSIRALLTEGRVVEVSSRTLLGKYLTRPSPEANELILGVLGRAQRLFPVDLFGFVFLSNHFHILLRALYAKLMADFVGFLKANTAKELGVLHDWNAKLWSGRYHSMPVGDSEAAQIERFNYILLNGCKENLVASPREWPGVTSAPSLCRGAWTMPARWFNRTKEYGRGKRQLFPERETVRLSPLPFLEGLTPGQQQEFYIEAVREVEDETAARHGAQGTRPLGVPAILRMNPHDSPDEFIPKRGVRFYAATLGEYFEMRDTYAALVAAYREASTRLRRGEENVRFPEGTFPAAAPFVESDSRGPPRAPP